MKFIQKNIVLPGIHGKPILTDVVYEVTPREKPVLIYAHGFNGFKDWGNFDLIAEQFAEAGFVFIKFNFSHNGTGPGHPDEFVDLDAFGNNNYTIELDDLGSVIDWAFSLPDILKGQAEANKLYLLGHSMGGGIAILKANEDPRVKALVTWASISECKTPWGNWPEEKIQKWKEEGVAFNRNTRTNQEMPLYFQLYENFIQNKERLDIQYAIQHLNIPILVCHGSGDMAVPIESAYQLKKWQPSAEIFRVESDHVFGRKHPWTLQNLPAPMQEVVHKTIEVLSRL